MLRRSPSDRACSFARRASASVVSRVKRWTMNITVPMTPIAEVTSSISETSFDTTAAASWFGGRNCT